MKWLILLTSVLVSAKGFLEDTDRTSAPGMLVYHESEVLFLLISVTLSNSQREFNINVAPLSIVFIIT